MPKYQYSPLNSDQDRAEIYRVLTLEPGSQLTPADLQSETCLSESSARVRGSFICLGHESSSNAVTCDGIPIKPNLENTLQHLQYPRRPRRLWIDALCINQEALNERAQQVLLMRKTYVKARSVLVWLGPRRDGVEDAFRLVSNLRFIWEFMNGSIAHQPGFSFNFEVLRAFAAAEEQGKVIPS